LPLFAGWQEGYLTCLQLISREKRVKQITQILLENCCWTFVCVCVCVVRDCRQWDAVCLADAAICTSSATAQRPQTIEWRGSIASDTVSCSKLLLVLSYLSVVTSGDAVFSPLCDCCCSYCLILILIVNTLLLLEFPGKTVTTSCGITHILLTLNV